MVRWVSGVVVVALLLSSVALTGVSTGGNEPLAAATGNPEPYDTFAQEFDSVTVDITVYENASARWTFRFTRPLNETTRPDFETFAEEFNTSEGELYTGFQQRGEALETDGRANTGREMNVTGYSKRAYVDESGFSLGSRGVVEMSFLWTQMAVSDGDRVIVGDVFEDGFYLGPRFSLVVRPGPGLAFVRALPDPDSKSDADSLRDSQSISWQGEKEFTVQRPLIELAPPDTVTTTTTQTTAPTTTVLPETPAPPTATPTGPTPTTTVPGLVDAPSTTPVGPGESSSDRTTAAANESDDGTMLVVGIILLLIGIGSVAVWRVTTTTTDEPGPTVATEAETTTPADSRPSETAESNPADQQAAGVAEEDLLSDTDRVKQLLESNGGRMRQSDIVAQTEWSKSKVSMLLSDMEDEDEITKLRVGRENLISLPGHEPEAAGSPFEDEE